MSNIVQQRVCCVRVSIRNLLILDACCIAILTINCCNSLVCNNAILLDSLQSLTISWYTQSPCYNLVITWRKSFNSLEFLTVIVCREYKVVETLISSEILCRCNISYWWENNVITSKYVRESVVQILCYRTCIWILRAQCLSVNFSETMIICTVAVVLVPILLNTITTISLQEFTWWSCDGDGASL